MLFHRSSRALEAGARLVACAVTLLIPVAARAVQQPDGKTIPVILSSTGTCDSGLNVEACLDDSEVLLGGAAGKVGALTNATIDREMFDPGCQLTFKVLSKGGSFYGHAFGWYRVRAGNVPPPLSELNVFLTCADTQMPGTTKVLVLPPGVGTIGFFTASYPTPGSRASTSGGAVFRFTAPSTAFVAARTPSAARKADSRTQASTRTPGSRALRARVARLDQGT